MRSIFIALAFLSCLAAQQPNTVTANVSVTQAIPAGTATFRIQLYELTLASTVDSAVAALAPASVNSSQLSGVNVAIDQGYIVTSYNFLVPVPSGELGAMRDKLITVQRNLANSQTQGISWSGTQTPTDEQLASALEQAMPALLERARQRATLLATAMNATLGAVVQLSAPAISPDGPTVTVSLSATFAVTPAQ